MKKLKALNKMILNAIDKVGPQILGLLILACVGLIVNELMSSPYKKPSDVADFAETSVKVVDRSQQIGGSGVILRSTQGGSEILTNKHVCRLLEGGGYIKRGEETMLAQAIKKYPDHDLCLVKVQKNLGVTTKVAMFSPVDYSPAYISGHPALLPHVLTTGNFSGEEIITLVVGIKECTKEDIQNAWMICAFFGGMPIIQALESQLVTGTILPGSSGSGVFNDKGEIAGLVFAGRGKGLGYAFIVPHAYVVDFLNVADGIPYTPVNRANLSAAAYRIFNVQKKCETKQNVHHTVAQYCRYIQSYPIGSKHDR